MSPRWSEVAPGHFVATLRAGVDAHVVQSESADGWEAGFWLQRADGGASFTTAGKHATRTAAERAALAAAEGAR